MRRGLITIIKAALTGVIALVVLILLALPGQEPGPARQAIPGAVFAQALHYDRHGAGQPCQDNGTLSDLGCCALVHSSATAIVMPSLLAAVRFFSRERAEYSATATPRADGIPAAPALPPPRAAA
jgi:hypothetical protein